MDTKELLGDSKALANSQDLIKDIASGDPYALKKFEAMNLDMKAIKTALDFLMSNDSMSEEEKANLLSESWRINFRAKPPTPEEFLTEKYLGPTAKTIYPRVKKTFVEFMNPTASYRNLILYPHIGWGKLCKYDTIVHTPTGGVKIQDLKIGDEVCTPYGGVSHVINKSDFPNEPIYKIVFSDGREAYAGGKHYWKASYKNREPNRPSDGKFNKDWCIITTEEIIKDMIEHPNHRWRIPLTQPVKMNGREHIIDPYTLGVFLGDGYFGKQIKLVGDDIEIFNECSWKNPTFSEPLKKKNYTVNYTCVERDKEVLKELDRLGLRNTNSKTKFIPDEYLYDSIENRISMLQGLMDTDGTVSVKNYDSSISFYTISERLKDGVKFLVNSLGGFAREYQYHNDNKHSGWTLYISFPTNDFPIFRLKRKQDIVDSCSRRNNRVKRKPYNHYIKAIEKTDFVGGMCIETDDIERLFLIDDFVVTHNSYLSTLITLYISVYVSLMKNPWKWFGLSPSTQLSQMLISYSLKKSSELLLEPYFNIMEASPFFEKVIRKDAMKEKVEEFAYKDTVDKLYYTTATPSSALAFDSGLTIKMGSSVQGLLGLTLISCVMSELAFFTDAGKSPEYIMRLYNDAKSRIGTRMKGNYFGRSILDSSPNSLTNPIDDYIVNYASADDSNFIVKGSMWEWEPEEYEEDFKNGDVFKVFTGGKGQPPRILDDNDPLLSDPNVDQTKIITVPAKGTDGKMKQYFIDDLPKSLKDRAGIPTGAADNIITDFQIIEDMFDNNLRNIYYGIHAPATDSPQRLIWNQVQNLFFKKRANEYEFYYLPYVPRVISVDQSTTKDITSISMAHIERNGDTGDNIYVVDFSITIIPTESKINLEAIGCFIRELKTLGHLTIDAVSFDRFQSETTIQNLQRDGFTVVNLSVDKKMGPYLNMISLLNQRRVKCGKNIFLKNNLKCLHITHSKRSDHIKIDHDASREQVITGDDSWEKSFIGYYGKDCSDSVAAVIELASKTWEVASSSWEGGPKAGGLNAKSNAEEAKDMTKELLKKMGLRL